MKKITLILVTIVFSQIVLAQPPSGKAKPGTVYGAKTDEKNAIEASSLTAMLKTKDTLTVKVKAKVLDVCSQKGCWMTFKINETENAFVKMKDYGFFVPLDLVGKTVVLDGHAFTKTTSVAELKHYAQDAKKSQKEIDAITEPKNEVRFMADGIVVIE
ncbi:DUF4920 domain-containing protein [Aurantibacillus circumpalustris]|uniref:DUF4920 domain-containing protein n=1 Tax=Aurantibacillus circumpalustris TaxID=3036359 RepID=UPI00295B348E|nr:DUF4920 domain-containing protein [Aurantibacillus circumpalustris]